jgi:hypothetical protein
MNAAFIVLDELTRRFEPSRGMKHGITLDEDADSLLLSVAANGRFYNFLVHRSDFDKDPIDLVEEALELLRESIREDSTSH